MPLHVSSTSAHRQEAKIVLYGLWYHHTYRWPSRAQVERGLRCTVSKISKNEPVSEILLILKLRKNLKERVERSGNRALL